MTGADQGGGNLSTTIKTVNSATSIVLNASAQTTVGSAAYYYGFMTLESTIASVQSSTTVTLSSVASGSISGAVFSYGTDNHAAFQKAVDTAGQAGGGLVQVPAPTNCPTGAVCGYTIIATDQMTAKAPGAVKIRYNNIQLQGDAPQTNLFCRGAYGSYTKTVAYGLSAGNIRGFCLTIGDDSGANGVAGEAVSNVTISQLHLYGMTNGNTFKTNFSYPPTKSDEWDVTHKAIYMWDKSTFSNITIDSVVIQDFKGENIYSGGSTVTGMMIQNSTLTNFNGNGISMLAADLKVLNNTISNGSNAGIENSTASSGGKMLQQQTYQGNNFSQFPQEAITIVGTDTNIATGKVLITSNSFDTIGEINGVGSQAAVTIGSPIDSNLVPPANVTISNNTCHDCYSWGIFNTSGNSTVQGNNFIVDQYVLNSVFSFDYPFSNITIENNTGSFTAQALARNQPFSDVYMVVPKKASGGYNWKNVVIKGNSWNFPGMAEYQFVTTAGPGWSQVTEDNLRWEGDVCTGCIHQDADHGFINLAQTNNLIEPYGPVVYVNGNAANVTATVDASKEEDGAQVKVVNSGTASVTFVSDANLSLPFIYTLPVGGSLTLTYSASLGKYTIGNAASAITASGGASQSAVINTAFATALQAAVKDANGYALVGVTVTFTAPSSGTSGLFSGTTSTTAVTDVNGIATAPTLTANAQTGTYSVTASAPGLAGLANFSMTNTAPISTSSATYSGMDATTQGTWTGMYGGDGYMIPNGGTTLPGYATVSQAGAGSYTWASPTSDVRALQTSSNSAMRIASTYYSGSSFSFDVNLTDGNAHRVALYLLDWDSSARTESISIVDAGTNAVLDSETFSSFHNGQYGVWSIKGHVVIRVTGTGGVNAVVSGLLFGPAGTVAPPSSSATFTGLDATTQGNWTGVYGGDGYQIANDASTLPGYAAASLSGATAYTWAAATPDVRALSTYSGSTTRIASTYYSGSGFTFDVNLTDGNSHRIALYLLDWDSNTRAETISILDASTLAVLSSEPVASFQNGVYASWNVKGHVLIQVTLTGGANAVVSGLFFGPAGSAAPPPPSATAAYVGADTATQGTWTGTYGSKGQIVPNDLNNVPAFASVSPAGANLYTWMFPTSDVRAPQSSSGSATRIASTYYAADNFKIDLNLTDGNAHRIALYLLDWDSTLRTETISILDASTNAVLSTQSYSGFGGGEYAIWNIKGHVVIQVTCTGGANAVLSGIFLD